MKKWIFLLTVPLLVAGCSDSRDYSIENPTDASMQVRIDEIAYDINPHQSKTVSLKIGEHRMEAPATGRIKFIVYANRKGNGMINPTLSNYVIANEIYVINDSKLKNFGTLDNLVQLDGVEFRGPFTLANDLFIDNQWKFGVNESFPSSVRGYDPGNGGNVFSKIFTESDFVAYYEDRHEQMGYFENNRHHASAVGQLKAPPELPVFADPDIQGASLKVRNTYERYVHAVDPAEQKQWQKEYSQQAIDFVHFAATKLYRQPMEENKKYDHFIRVIGNAFGVSARVEN
jgi:hypothetical protein